MHFLLLIFDRRFWEADLVYGFDKYQEMTEQVLNNKRVQDGLSEILLDLVFAGFAKRRGDGPVAR